MSQKLPTRAPSPPVHISSNQDSIFMKQLKKAAITVSILPTPMSEADDTPLPMGDCLSFHRCNAPADQSNH